jgi:hypothetical protein
MLRGMSRRLGRNAALFIRAALDMHLQFRFRRSPFIDQPMSEYLLFCRRFASNADQPELK